MRNNVKTIFVAIFCCVLWGSAFPVIKIGYEFWGIAGSDTMSIIEFAGIRFLLAGILVILFASVQTKKIIVPKVNEFPYVMVLSLFQTIGQYIAFYIGLAHTSGVNGAVINSLNTVFAVVVACFVFRTERLGLRKILGCVLGVVGVTLVSATGDGLSVNFLGDGLIVLTSLCYGVSSNLIKRFSKDHDTVMLSGYQFIFGGLVMIIVGVVGRRGEFLFEVKSGIWAVTVLVYLALVSSVAYTLWGLLLRTHDVSKIAVYGFATPVAGVILSMILLGESAIVGWRYVAALLLVSMSIVIVNYSKEN